MENAQIADLKAAMQQIKDLGIPEHLQDTALKHLLGSTTSQKVQGSAPSPRMEGHVTGGSLRSFVEPLTLKNAMTQIPTLLYWAKMNGDREDADERGVVELYRRAGMRPPKNVYQSLKDLSSKKYLRLEPVEGKPKHYRLSRTGEDFVLHEVLQGS